MSGTIFPVLSVVYGTEYKRFPNGVILYNTSPSHSKLVGNSNWTSCYVFGFGIKSSVNLAK